MEHIIVIIVVFIFGAFLGNLTNYFVDCFCWTPRFRSPWRVLPLEFIDRLNSVSFPVDRRKKKKQQTQNSEPFAKIWLDFVPIIGWISLSRIGTRLKLLSETERLPGLESHRFWLRPFFIELFAAIGCAWLFVWEVQEQMLLPEGIIVRETWETVFLRFCVHLIFFTFLLAASLIDIDDMIIPDVLTIPGTILGLVFAVWIPQTFLPVTEIHNEVILTSPRESGKNPMEYYDIRRAVAPQAVPLNICSPNPINTVQHKLTNQTGQIKTIILLSLLWSFWCFAMLPRIWYTKLPFQKSAAIFCRWLYRSPRTKWLVVTAILGSVGFAIIVSNYPATSIGLLTALIGMASGMILIWSIRLIGGVVLGREAMGFGDVTLMGMIGMFLGWQSCILIFFLAPFAGLILGVLNMIAGRNREFPYGPFLCLATVGLVVTWRPIWASMEQIFELGGFIIGTVMLFCFIMFGILLGLWRKIRDRLIT
ncbi:MAG: A24 family peptidase [Planctomycetaceae bacterium]|jgi:prepilin signal peptidase PulO-like enzyme (type II secretory pathway)|nr:A24 family peptidase [Planctomycetaceae bacterium]